MTNIQRSHNLLAQLLSRKPRSKYNPGSTNKLREALEWCWARVRASITGTVGQELPILDSWRNITITHDTG